MGRRRRPGASQEIQPEGYLRDGETWKKAQCQAKRRAVTARTEPRRRTRAATAPDSSCASSSRLFTGRRWGARATSAHRDMSQNESLLNQLRAGRKITPASAYELCGTLALHSRICELRAAGHDIRGRIVTEGRKRWGEYWLAGQLEIGL